MIFTFATVVSLARAMTCFDVQAYKIDRAAGRVIFSTGRGTSKSLVPVDDVDIGSFEQLEPPPPSDEMGELRGECTRSYAKDRRQVYFAGKPLAGADPALFVRLSHRYARSGSKIYFDNVSVAGADAANFHVVRSDFATDASHIYFGTKTFPKETYRQIGPYTLAGPYVWYSGRIMEGAHSASFKQLTEFYAKDDASVFFQMRRVEGADPRTFVMISGERARDAQSIYNGGYRVVADAASYRDLGACFYSDRAGLRSHLSLANAQVVALPGATEASRFALVSASNRPELQQACTDKILGPCCLTDGRELIFLMVTEGGSHRLSRRPLEMMTYSTQGHLKVNDEVLINLRVADPRERQNLQLQSLKVEYPSTLIRSGK